MPIPRQTIALTRDQGRSILLPTPYAPYGYKPSGFLQGHAGGGSSVGGDSASNELEGM